MGHVPLHELFAFQIRVYLVLWCYKASEPICRQETARKLWRGHTLQKRRTSEFAVDNSQTELIESAG